jgi:hypothetical protein
MITISFSTLSPFDLSRTVRITRNEPDCSGAANKFVAPLRKRNNESEPRKPQLSGNVTEPHVDTSNSPQICYGALST